MLSTNTIKKIIIKNDIISKDNLDKMMTEAKREGVNIINYLIDKKVVTEKVIYESISKHFKVPFVELSAKKIRKDILNIIPEPIATTHHLLAFDQNDKGISVATDNPENLEMINFLKKKTGKTMTVHVATTKAIKDALQQYHKSLKANLSSLTANTINDESMNAEDRKHLEKLAEDSPVVRIVDTTLEYAISKGASDIHIEPEEKDVIVRYRVDGVLHDEMTLPKDIQPGIIARIKILSNLKVDEHRLPQDGRFKISNSEFNVSFRVSIIPTYDGEKIVMRLLNEKARMLTLEQLGFQQKNLDIIKRNIKKPHGMILAVGPTGSGKTTTLYTILNAVNSPTVNISTVEDPIEYRMERINQSQINTKIGFTFAKGLRSLLRQDPDIIMVGEIRDEETAQIAAHAAMTGHLVLSTLHTNDAVTTLPRLNDMGVPHFLVATTVNLIVAQRLVRKICPNCVQSFNLDKHMISELGNDLNIDRLLKKLEDDKIITKNSKGLESLLFYKGIGCEKCNKSGYKGRVGLYELLELTEEIQHLILSKAGADEIKKKAEEQDMISILEDGFIKATNGITTIEEVMRVTKD